MTPPPSDCSKDVAMATNFRVKIGKNRTIHLYSYFLQSWRTKTDRHSDFETFICDDLARLYVNLVNLTNISGSTWLIFTTFSPYGRYLIVDYGSDLISDHLKMLPWQPILASKLTKSQPLFVCDDLAILCINLVNLCPITPECKRVVDVQPRI